MKQCVIVNTIIPDRREVSKAGLKRYMSKYEKDARALLKTCGARHVLYGVIHEPGTDKESYHVVKPLPCSDTYLRMCFPKSGKRMKPLVVSGR